MNHSGSLVEPQVRSFFLKKNKKNPEMDTAKDLATLTSIRSNEANRHQVPADGWKRREVPVCRELRPRQQQPDETTAGRTE